MLQLLHQRARTMVKSSVSVCLSVLPSLIHLESGFLDPRCARKWQCRKCSKLLRRKLLLAEGRDAKTMIQQFNTVSTAAWNIVVYYYQLPCTVHNSMCSTCITCHAVAVLTQHHHRHVNHQVFNTVTWGQKYVSAAL